MERGDIIKLTDGEHEVVGIERDAVFIERLVDGNIRKYTVAEAETLVESARRKGWYEGPWPFTTSTHINSGRWCLEEQFREMGMSEEDRLKFKYPIGEIEIQIEIHRSGDVYLTAIAGQPLTEKIKAT